MEEKNQHCGLVRGLRGILDQISVLISSVKAKSGVAKTLPLLHMAAVWVHLGAWRTAPFSLDRLQLQGRS